MKKWQFMKREKIEVVTREDWLNQGVDVAFSTRNGGISQGCYYSLNLGLHVGDQAELVLENRSRYLELFDTNLDDVVCCQQIHGTGLIRVDENHRGRGGQFLDQALKDCDAMITNSPGIYLLTFYADCIPLYFFDPINRAIGLAHSGWKGTMDQIAIKTLQAMQREFGSSCSEVQVFIGPGIGPCCFQIQKELLVKLQSEFTKWRKIVYYDENGTMTWDLPETNRLMLIDNGVYSENIVTCELCTSCHPQHFFSYRRDKGQTGRMGALIGLKKI